MRYGDTENTQLLGNFEPGSNVTITIVDLIDDSNVLLTSSVCTESQHIPGLYMFDVANNMIVTGYSNFAYQMTDGENIFRGKFVYGNTQTNINIEDIRDEIVSVVHGELEIVDNQLIIYDKVGSEVVRFNLFDKNGNPTMGAVFKRTIA